jgi:hypothetical protein
MFIAIVCIIIGMILTLVLRKWARMVVLGAVVVILLVNLDKILKLAEAVRRLADAGHFLGAW